MGQPKLEVKEACFCFVRLMWEPMGRWSACRAFGVCRVTIGWRFGYVVLRAYICPRVLGVEVFLLATPKGPPAMYMRYKRYRFYLIYVVGYAVLTVF